MQSSIEAAAGRVGNPVQPFRDDEGVGKAGVVPFNVRSMLRSMLG